jgi:hypothetical protein
MPSWDEIVARTERMRPKIQPLVNQPKPVEPDDKSEFGKGWKAGLYQTAAVAPAVVSMAGKAVGADSVAEWGAEKAGGLMEKASEYEGETSFEELIDSPTLEGATNWFLHTAGTVAPSMIIGMTGAGIGAKALGGLALKKMSKSLIANKAKGLVTEGVAKDVAVKLAAKQLASKAVKYGAAAGIVATTAPQEAAHNFMTDVEQHGIENASPGKAALTGTAAGLVELGFGGGHLRLINKVLGVKAGKVATKELSKLAKIGKVGDEYRLVRMLKEAVIQGGGEGLQELTQEELSILNEIWTGEDQSLFEKKNLLRAGESFAAGAVMGVPTGGVTGVFSKAPVDNSGDTKGGGDTGTKVKGRTIDLGDIPGPDEYARMEAAMGEDRGQRGFDGVRGQSLRQRVASSGGKATIVNPALESAAAMQNKSVEDFVWDELAKEHGELNPRSPIARELYLRELNRLEEEDLRADARKRDLQNQAKRNPAAPVDELSVAREAKRNELRKSPDERGRETQGAAQTRDMERPNAAKSKPQKGFTLKAVDENYSKDFNAVEAQRALNEYGDLFDDKVKNDLAKVANQKAIGPIEAERMLNEHERLNLPMDPKLKAELQDIIYQSASQGQRINRKDVDYSQMKRSGNPWLMGKEFEPYESKPLDTEKIESDLNKKTEPQAPELEAEKKARERYWAEKRRKENLDYEQDDAAMEAAANGTKPARIGAKQWQKDNVTEPVKATETAARTPAPAAAVTAKVTETAGSPKERAAISDATASEAKKGESVKEPLVQKVAPKKAAAVKKPPAKAAPKKKLATDRRAHPADPGGAQYTDKKRRNPLFPRSKKPDRRQNISRAKQVAAEFKKMGFGSTVNGDTVRVSTPTGNIAINIADSVVGDDSATIRMAYGKEAKPGEKVVGSYFDGEIKLKRNKADRFILSHELFHHMKAAGLFTAAEEKILSRKGSEEAQARWVERQLRNRGKQSSVVRKLIQKIADFLDALANVFVRTEKGLVRSVESGKILKRTEANPSETAMQLATKKITDTPAFRKWFGKSKVVDEDGDPLVVYQGRSKKGLTTLQNPRGDIWATDVKKSAENFANVVESYYPNRPEGKQVEREMRGEVYEVFLSAQNPKIINHKITLWDSKKEAQQIALAKKEGHDSLFIKHDNGKTDYVVFSPTQIKSATGNKGTFDETNPDIRYATAVEGEQYTLPLTNMDKAKSVFNRKFNDAMYWIVDKNYSIDVTQKKLGELTDQINVFLKETQRPKITAAKVEKFWEDEVQPLIKKMARYGVNVEDLELYSHAKHVIGDNLNQLLRERNAKIQVEEIIGVLDKKESKAVEASVKGVKAPADWLKHLEEIFDAHKNNEDVQMLKAKWDKFAEKPSGMTDKDAKAVLKQYEGDEKIEELRKMMLNINEGRLDLLFDAGQIPKEEYDRIVKKYKYYVPLYREGYDDSMFGTTRGLKPSGRQVKVRGGSTRNVVNIFANTVANYEKAINISEKAVSQRALYGLAKANIGSETLTIRPVKKSPRTDKNGNIRMYPNLFEVEPNEMRIMVDGKQYLIEVNKDDKDAMLMMRTLKADDGMNGPIVNFLARINRFLARINTTWSPEFIISNFLRDFGTANINIRDTGVKGENMFSGARKAIVAILAVERGKRKGTDLEKMYDRFKAAGGKIGWADVHGSVENLSKKITREIEMQSGKRPTRAAIKGWLDLIDNANTAIENGIRLHTFKLATEQGKTDERAAQIASDLTVDFTKKGAAGPVINSLYLFANAGIQGSYRILRASIKSRSVQKVLAGIVGTSFVVGILNSMAGEDEDGEDYFNKIDDFVRERNMIFMIPGTKGKYAKIPAPWGYNLFWNIGSELSRAVTKENFSAMSSAGRLISIAAGAFNPVQSGTLLQTLSPTVADPFVMVSENKNWFGGDLMPAVNKFERVPTPDSQRYWKSASSGSKWVAGALNKLTRGDKIKSGAIDVSPETLDLILDTAGGSALRFFKDSIGVPLAKIRGEEIEAHKIPFYRRVAGDQPAWANSRIYYENIENVLIAKERLKAYKGTVQYKNVLIATKDLRKMMPLAEQSEKRLRKLRKSLKAAEVSGDKDRVETIKKRMNAVYNRFNKFYNKEK